MKQRAKTIDKYIYALSRAISRRRRDIQEDLLQEGELIKLELKLNGAVEVDQKTKTTINKKLSCLANLLTGHEISLNAFVDYISENASLNRLKSTSMGKLRGPKHSPINRHAKHRHKAMANGCCPRCGSKLPDREYTKCEICRAKERLYYMKSKRGRDCMRRNASKYDTVLQSLASV